MQAYSTWIAGQETLLLLRVKENVSRKDIAMELGRTEGAILKRLQKIAEMLSKTHTIDTIRSITGLSAAEWGTINKTVVYTLELEGGNYYVGKTNNYSSRIAAHSSGNGAAFTQKYKMIKVVEMHDEKSIHDEQNTTLELMNKYGIDNVRGGSWVQVVLDESTKAEINKQLNMIYGRCYKCGGDHFGNKCNVNNVQRQPLSLPQVPSNIPIIVPVATISPIVPIIIDNYTPDNILAEVQSLMKKYGVKSFVYEKLLSEGKRGPLMDTYRQQYVDIVAMYGRTNCIDCRWCQWLGTKHIHDYEISPSIIETSMANTKRMIKDNETVRSIMQLYGVTECAFYDITTQLIETSQLIDAQAQLYNTIPTQSRLDNYYAIVVPYKELKALHRQMQLAWNAAASNLACEFCSWAAYFGIYVTTPPQATRTLVPCYKNRHGA